MTRLGLRGLCLVALSALACRKPTPHDAAEEAFHATVVRFAETSKLTQDLTYRDPRFDPILDALDRIPGNAECKPSALALADRIRGARTLANSQERDSRLLQSQAEAPPSFEPQVRLPSMAARAAAAEQDPSPSPRPDVGGSASRDVAGAKGGAPSLKDPVRHLPSWYASYFGSPEGAQDAGAASAPPEETAPVAEPDSHPGRRSPLPPSPGDAPPPVFGLPGPAAGAIYGRPKSE